MSEWVSVKERRPKHGVSVLCVGPGKNKGFVSQTVSAKNDVGWKWYHDFSGNDPSLYFTHWMPIPAPPPSPPSKDEALREVIAEIERCPASLPDNTLFPSESLWESQKQLASMLPRLRAALGEG